MNGNFAINNLQEWNSKIESGVKNSLIFTKHCDDGHGALLYGDDGRKDQQNSCCENNVIAYHVESKIEKLSGSCYGLFVDF